MARLQRTRNKGRDVFVAGVGMTKFERPGRLADWDYPDMVREAATAALADAAVRYDEIEHVAVGYVYGESTSGQRAAYELGPTGVPVVNVNIDCSTGADRHSANQPNAQSRDVYTLEEILESPMIDAGETTYAGRWVVSPSGGLISKGHPLGATGLAQCAEPSWQLRGEAGQRQVDGAVRALQHNIGLGGAAVVTLYERG